MVKPLVKEYAAKIFKALKCYFGLGLNARNFVIGSLLRPACPSVQSEKWLCCSLVGKLQQAKFQFSG